MLWEASAALALATAFPAASSCLPSGFNFAAPFDLLLQLLEVIEGLRKVAALAAAVEQIDPIGHVIQPRPDDVRLGELVPDAVSFGLVKLFELFAKIRI